jgi:hypothetical protein
MIDIATETLLTLPQAAQRIPSSRAGRPTNPARRAPHRGAMGHVHRGTPAVCRARDPGGIRS